jgi:hypothetical protein
MSIKNRSGSMIITLLLCSVAPALAQTAPSTSDNVPLQKTIGQTKPEIVPSLIVMNARGASLQDGKLTLTGTAPNSIVFADRPVRAAGHSLTADLLKEWSPNNESDESFTRDPPNATISVFSADGSKVRDAVVVLKTAKLESDRLVFDVDVLEGDLAGGDGPAALFIDRLALAASTPVASMLVASAASAADTRVWGTPASLTSPVSGIIPTSLAVPGIAGLHTQLLRSAGPRSVRRPSVPRQRTRTAATTRTRLATDAVRMTRARLDHRSDGAQ